MLPDSTSAGLTRDKLTSAESAAVQTQGISSNDALSAVDQRSLPPNRPYTARSPLQPSDQDYDRRQHRDDYPLPHTSHANLNSLSGAPQPSSRQPPAHSEGRKASRSGFFHFSKGSRVATQPLPATQHFPDKQQDHAASRSGEHLATDNSGGTCFPLPLLAHCAPRRIIQPAARPRLRPPFLLLSRANPRLFAASSQTGSIYGQDDLQRPNLPFSSQSQISLSSAGDTDSAPTASGKLRKSKPFGLLGRSKSNRDKDRPSPKPAPATLPNTPSIPIAYDNSAPLRTAPVAQDRAFREMMNSSIRNRSEDRAPARNGSASRETLRDRERDNNHKMHSSSYKENGGSTFLSGLRGSRAADIFSKGLFGKSTRSGSTTEKEPVIDDEHYALKVLNLPLVEQTRLTRISKRLEHSRDKTEFWMPAFPWRAIDYLNYKGCDVEGLYRVPGSGPQIKKWQRRFDERMLIPLDILALT